MTLRTLKDVDGRKVYAFDGFWDFVVLCVMTYPRYTLRAYIYAVVGWMIGMGFGILATEITWRWAATQAVLLLIILVACSWITYFSLRKEWLYLKSTNLIQRVSRKEGA